MGSFTGRPNTGRAKKIGSSILDGLSLLGTALSDGPKHARIEEIDQIVADLLQERDHLINDLIEPGNLRVSENFDPRWSKPSTIVQVDSSDGRLTQCSGSWRDNDPFDASHPGCPYRKQQHIAHEFTLRD